MKGHLLTRLLALVTAAVLVVGLAPPALSAATTRPGALQGKAADGLAPQPYRSPSGRHKLVVPAGGPAPALKVQGARLVAAYDSFQLYEATTAAADALAAGGAAELRDDYNLILLNAGPIDTTTPAAAALQGAEGVFSGKRMRLVQFAGPVHPAWYAELRKTGVEIVTAIPHNAYLVYGDAGALAALDALARGAAFVQWSGAYRDEYRASPSLLAAPADAAPQPIAVQLYVDPPANAATLALIDGLRQGGVQRQEILHYINLVVTVAPAAIWAIAARPDVVSIGPYVEPTLNDESQNQIIAGNLSGNGPASGDYLAQLAAWGFTQEQFDASGFAVDVADSGVDNGTTSPNHFGLYRGGVRPGTSRVVYNRLQGTPNTGSTLQGRDGHGTLDAHIVGGYVPGGAPYNAFPHADASGFRYGLGVAPFVRLGSSVFFDPDSFTSPNFANSLAEAYQDGARISTNSWGASVDGAYTIASQTYDALVRDAQPTGSTAAAAGNQEMVTIFSAGNDGPVADTIGAPATAKNVLTVGASEGVRPFGGADASGVDDSGANSYNDIIDFSSRGPTDDGRQKPDVVAPGTHITGGLFQAVSPAANGTADASFVGSGVSGGTGGSPFFPAGQQWYTASSGTSHSAPAVAGAAALLRQHFINQGRTPPSPAMTKAYLVNSARHLTGAFANDTLPSPNQGMGLVDLGRAFASTPRVLRDQRSIDTFTASGQSRGLSALVADTSQPLRVTLAWTDAPGPTSGAAYLNDLNLAVTVNGQTYRGNVFSGANSATGGSSDQRNNVESIFLPAGLPAPTTVTITITAANIVADGVPNSGGPLDQDFALVVSNATEVTEPVIEDQGVTLTAESFQPANGALDPGEMVTVDLALRNVGSAPTLGLSAALAASGGVTEPSPAQSYGALAALGGAGSASYTFRVDPALACGATVTTSFQLTDGPNSLGVVTADLPVGAYVPSGSLAGENGAPLTLPDGVASLYPSDIVISGAPGRVVSVTVTLTGLSHSFSDDLDILLAAPGGKAVMLMSDAGGANGLAGVDLTFDDLADPLPNSDPIVSGRYAPSNYGSGDSMSSPAPGEPYGTTLATFAGSDPNGAWRLYIRDDATDDTGTLAGGWSISIGTEELECAPPGATLSDTSEVITSESGGADSFTISLNKAPTADVTIPVASSDPTEATVAPLTLTFTPANWYIPQTVTATGVRDDEPDGAVPYAITFGAALSGDPAYSGFDPPDVGAVNEDTLNIFLPLGLR
jgi:subtilisin-like proprotein convertase family protein